MFTRFRLPLVALVLAAPAALSAQSAQDFQLPPNPTPTSTPNVQGPVDTEGSSVPVRPRVIATPTPRPTPTRTGGAMVQPIPQASATPAATTTRPPTTPTTPVPTPTSPRVQPPQREILPAPQSGPITEEPLEQELPSATESAPVVQPRPATPAASEPVATEEGTPWLWPAIGGGILALFGIGYLFSRRRRDVEPPQIERPIVAPTNAAISPADLQLRAEAIKLTRSVMNATLHYRVHLLNRSNGAIGDVALGADVVSAHGGIPVEQQVASSTQALERRHVFDRIAPGQSVRYEGQVVIPLSQARIIRQGNASLFVPLLRVRVDGVGEEPLVKTFVIGQGVPDGGRVSPFRLDDGPRSYQPIAARALD